MQFTEHINSVYTVQFTGARKIQPCVTGLSLGFFMAGSHTLRHSTYVASLLSNSRYRRKESVLVVRPSAWF